MNLIMIFFFYSEDDKIACRKEPYNDFENTITYFKKYLDINNIEILKNLIDKYNFKLKEI